MTNQLCSTAIIVSQVAVKKEPKDETENRFIEIKREAELKTEEMETLFAMIGEDGTSYRSSTTAADHPPSAPGQVKKMPQNQDLGRWWGEVRGTTLAIKCPECGEIVNINSVGKMKAHMKIHNVRKDNELPCCHCWKGVNAKGITAHLIQGCHPTRALDTHLSNKYPTCTTYTQLSPMKATWKIVENGFVKCPFCFSDFGHNKAKPKQSNIMKHLKKAHGYFAWSDKLGCEICGLESMKISDIPDHQHGGMYTRHELIKEKGNRKRIMKSLQVKVPETSILRAFFGHSKEQELCWSSKTIERKGAKSLHDMGILGSLKKSKMVLRSSKKRVSKEFTRK